MEILKWIMKKLKQMQSQNRLKVFENFKDSNNGNNVMFIGDDVTDEDGFDALVNLLNYEKNDKTNDNISTIFSILVTHNKVRETKAAYFVNTMKDIEMF